MARARPAGRYCELAGGLRVGADYFDRRGLSRDSPPRRGVVDRLADLDNPRVEIDRVHPDVATFFEDTSSLELSIRSVWCFPFNVAWALTRPLFRLLGQLRMPWRRARILTRVHALDLERDGRSDARAVVRTYAGTGIAMQVIAYATSEIEGARYMNAAFPLPGGNLTGLLRLESTDVDGAGRHAVALDSRRRGSDAAGVFFVTRRSVFALPLAERFELWAAGSPGVPDELAGPGEDGATVVGRHVQWMFGLRVVEHRYRFRPRGEAEP